jgi:hypothetical protein
MVAAVENWAHIGGEVLAVRSDPELPDHVVATVAVRSADAVARPEGGDFPNLFEALVGDEVDVHVPVRLAAARQLAAGRRITARAKRSRPTRAFVTELEVD